MRNELDKTYEKIYEEDSEKELSRITELINGISQFATEIPDDIYGYKRPEDDMSLTYAYIDGLWGRAMSDKNFNNSLLYGKTHTGNKNDRVNEYYSATDTMRAYQKPTRYQNKSLLMETIDKCHNPLKKIQRMLLKW